jgi:uncharacterized membrane protein
LKEVCEGAKKTANCEAVLNSSKSKFLGISWALWGFSFMSTLFFTQILFANQLPNLIISSLLSIIVTPYIAFSVYYQARNKQWCRLCLGVQVVLAINAVLAFIMLKNSITIFAMLDYYTISTTVFLGLVFLLLGCHAVPILKKAFDSKNYEKRLRRLRYNPDIFQALLNNNPLITKSTDGVGLVVGNPQATTELIKVCNPYCAPCSKAHPHLEEIIKGNPDVKIRIIFTASGEDEDIKTAPVAHLLAIQDKQGQAGVEQALNDWYSASRKDYGSFAAKYPMNGEINAQKEKIIAMRNWCNDMKIRATPTLFINGRELPEGYAISELKNFF